MMGQRINNVVIVGAGPVGLLGALELARLGISVDVIDCLEGVDSRPRAAGYGPSAVRYDCAFRVPVGESLQLG